MEFKIQLPTCPVCEQQCLSFTIDSRSDISQVEQNLNFQCGASFKRDAKVDFKHPYTAYGNWSEWLSRENCSKSQEIALKLIAEAKSKQFAKLVAPPSSYPGTALPPPIGTPPPLEPM